MCIEAPHSFDDIYQATPPEDRYRLEQDLGKARAMLGDYRPEEAGEAVTLYRLCTRQFKTPDEEKTMRRALAHYWAGLLCMAEYCGHLHLRTGKTLSEAFEDLGPVEHKIQELANRDLGVSTDQDLEAAFRAGQRADEVSLQEAFRELAEMGDVN